eukprot:TRINITY_DN67833_c0_g1_i1.p1 TRINITY_DN67833_c0_g1~~TRINITY_DN67833_c0_g1_i1.p1  ORF type:complete len:324 (-),score=37.39 TRINITY_DN67833_c0_g1_i1:311-1234(-)
MSASRRYTRAWTLAFPQAGSRPAFSTWHMLSDPAVAEIIVANSRPEAAIIDCQHGTIGAGSPVPASLLRAVAAAHPTCIPFARTPSVHALHDCHSLLDVGARGIICPLVDTPEQATAFVKACTYGAARSYGPTRAALPHVIRAMASTPDGDTVSETPAYTTDLANERVIRMAMIETAEGLANVAAIAATPGLDGLFIGPNDLAVAVGATPSSSPTDARVIKAIDAILAAATDAGIAAGIYCGDGATARRFAARGFDLCILGADVALIGAAAGTNVSAARDPVPAGGEEETATEPPERKRKLASANAY